METKTAFTHNRKSRFSSPEGKEARRRQRGVCKRYVEEAVDAANAAIRMKSICSRGLIWLT